MSLLTTTACLLSPNRNPHLDRAGLERALADLLGAERVLWLEHGALAGGGQGMQLVRRVERGPLHACNRFQRNDRDDHRQCHGGQHLAAHPGARGQRASHQSGSLRKTDRGMCRMTAIR